MPRGEPFFAWAVLPADLEVMPGLLRRSFLGLRTIVTKIIAQMVG
jgi:hypothetical protein